MKHIFFLEGGVVLVYCEIPSIGVRFSYPISENWVLFQSFSNIRLPKIGVSCFLQTISIEPR